jgi:hypothetical protein
MSEVGTQPQHEPSAPNELEEEEAPVEPSPEFSLSSFSSTNTSSNYPMLHSPDVYVQKGYEERLADRERTNKITGGIDFTPTDDLKGFEQSITQLDKLKEKTVPDKTPNWLKSLVSFGQKMTGDVTESPPELQISDPAFYHQYFVNGVSTRSPLALNPEFTSPTEHLLKRAMSLGAPVKDLTGSGMLNLNSLQLANLGLMMMHFRVNKRTPSDLRALWNTTKHLEEAGFTAKSFDSNFWSLQAIANAYGCSQIDIASQFNMSPSDMLTAGVPFSELRNMNIAMEHLTSDPHFFKLIVASKMKPRQFIEYFDATPRNFFNEDGKPRLNVDQVTYLGHTQQWNRSNLTDAGFTVQEANAFLGNTPLRLNSK